ncbi:MAG: hypothetical protein KDC79_04455 [Cyclobacteriaceae bacterium]|nr:hypothetical protein [Cyclobacteriaceae bacterium]
MKKQLTFLFVLLTALAFGQSRIHQGQVYDEGDSIYAPAYGIKSIVPQWWVGMLPQGSEIFLLSSKKGKDAQIYVFADTATFDQLKRGWMQGLELSEGRTLKSDGTIVTKGDKMHSGVVLTGGYNSAYSGYIEARCGEYGRCLQLLLICPLKDLDEMKEELEVFLANTSFIKPILIADNAGFDWKLFLSGKHLVSYENSVGTKSVNELWLCPDGSFTSKLKRSGLVKGEAGKYKGRKKGTWETNSIGGKGTLLLKFDKLPTVEVDLTTEDDKTFLNGRRHLVLNATNCN